MRLCTLLLHIHVPYAMYGWLSLGLAVLWMAVILYGNLFGRFRSQTRTIVLTRPLQK